MKGLVDFVIEFALGCTPYSRGGKPFLGGGAKGHRRYCGMISGPHASKPQYILQKGEKVSCTGRVTYEEVFHIVKEKKKHLADHKMMEG
jgi:hypothetical protein